MSADDEKCVPARDSRVAGIGPIRPVATNIRVNVVRMWSAHGPRCADQSVMRQDWGHGVAVAVVHVHDGGADHPAVSVWSGQRQPVVFGELVDDINHRRLLAVCGYSNQSDRRVEGVLPVVVVAPPCHLIE